MRTISVVVASGAALLALTACSNPPPPEPRTVTRTVQVETVPQACLDALDAADDAFDVSARAFETSSSMFEASSAALQAVLDGDFTAAYEALDRMDQGSADLDALTAELDVEAYTAAREECRAVAR